MSKENLVPIPPHLRGASGSAPGDSGGYFPDAETARSYSARAVESAYGLDRLRAVRSLLRRVHDLPGRPVVVDFGGGDGAFLQELDLRPSEVFLIDVSPHMLDLAAPRFPSVDLHLVEGSVETMAAVGSGTVDLVLAINAVNYLTPDQRSLFLREVGRVLRPGGSFIMLAGNELIDLFALNAGTADFFRRRFGAEIDELLSDSKVSVWRNADRENPLSLGPELRGFGLLEVGQSFSQWHDLPPGLAVRRAGGDVASARLSSRDHALDPDQLPALDRWQAYFRCSMFGSLSMKA